MPGEPIKEFLIELKRLACTCNFGFLEEALRDRLMCRMTSNSSYTKEVTDRKILPYKELSTSPQQRKWQYWTINKNQQCRFKVKCIVYVTQNYVMRVLCGKWGHTANRCRFCTMTCYKCWQQGHLQVVCKEQVKAPPKS